MSSIPQICKLSERLSFTFHTVKAWGPHYSKHLSLWRDCFGGLLDLGGYFYRGMSVGYMHPRNVSSMWKLGDDHVQWARGVRYTRATLAPDHPTTQHTAGLELPVVWVSPVCSASMSSWKHYPVLTWRHDMLYNRKMT